MSEQTQVQTADPSNSSAAAILAAASPQGGNPNVGDTGPDKPAVPGAAPNPPATVDGNTLKVMDLTATADCPVRDHEMVVDDRVQKFAFSMGEAKVMPYTTALKFSQNPGFEVSHMDDRPFVAPPSDVDERDEIPKISLEDDEVIARMDELVKPALLVRAQIIDDTIKDSTGKDELVAFLKADRLAKKKANSSPDSSAGVGGSEAMSDADLDGLFGDEHGNDE